MVLEPAIAASKGHCKEKSRHNGVPLVRHDDNRTFAALFVPDHRVEVAK